MPETTPSRTHPGRLIYAKPESLADRSSHYCPGCGHGIIHRLVAELLDELELGPGRSASPRSAAASSPTTTCRSTSSSRRTGVRPAVATGVRRARPDAFVFTYQGDGDLAAIGTAEIVHAAARGERISVIFVNNGIYGMTGGQMAPTTLLGQRTTSSPTGREASAGRLPAPDHRDARPHAGRLVRGARVDRRPEPHRQDQGDDPARVRDPARRRRAVDRRGPLDLPGRLGADARSESMEHLATDVVGDLPARRDGRSDAPRPRAPRPEA